MDESKTNHKQKESELKTFNVPFDLIEIKENIYLNTNEQEKSTKEQIINEAFKFHSQGNISEAEKYYKYCIDHELYDPRVFSNYGVICKKKGKIKEAMDLYKKSISLFPTRAEAYSNLGGIYKMLGKSKEAERYIRKAIQVKPDFAEAHFNLGNILMEDGKLKEAAKCTREAIKFNPDNAIYHFNLGSILITLGQLEEAELSIRESIKLNPTFVEAYCNLGLVLRQVDRNKEAINCFEKALKIRPWSINSLYGLNHDIKNLKSNKMWNQELIEKGKDILKPFIGWNYACIYDSKYFSNIKKKRLKKNYEYKEEPKKLEKELLKLEELNRSTSLKVISNSNSKIAIIGCGPVGMSIALWLKRSSPDREISIFESRIDIKSNKLKPFSRRWLTYIKLDLLSPILNPNDNFILEKIGLNGYIGVDIRNLEYCLLRAINKNNIDICNIDNISKPKMIIDASGGNLISHDSSKKINRKILKIINPIAKSMSGQEATPLHKLNKLHMVNFGSIIKPFYNELPIQIPFLKINYLPPEIKSNFIYFANKLNNEYGVFYWNGLMRSDLNHSLLILSLYQDEFNNLDDLIDSPIRLDNAWSNDKFRQHTSKRITIIFEWLLSSLDKKNMCYLEPLFLWQPYLCVRNKRTILENIEYLNVGDSYYIGNPKVGNGLSNHLKELKDIFYTQ